MKRIIVEGMDSTGKTTLINELVSRYHNLEVIVNEKGPDQNFNYWLPAILWDREPTSLTPIHDRFFYSELVYGKVLRGRTNIVHVLRDAILTELREKALLVYARPPIEVIRRTLSNNQQMDGVHDHWEDLLVEYDRLMEMEREYYRDRYLVHDWYLGWMPDTINKIGRYLQV